MECFDQASFCFENRAQDAPKARQDAPRWPKTPQNSSKIPQDAPKTPQDAPGTAPRGSKTPQDAPKAPQDTRKTSQDASKMRFWWVSGAQLEPSWPPKSRPNPRFAQFLLSGKGAKAHQHVTNRFTQQRPGAPERQPRFTDRPRRVREAKRIFKIWPNAST